jgi:ATP-binding cassette subfamily B protein
MIRRGHRIPVIRQMTATDCGAAALAMVLAHHGRPVPLDEVRRILRPGRSGANAASILAAGSAYGLRGRCVGLDLEQLSALPAAAILHWEFRHFVVLQRVAGEAIEIVDPAVGPRVVSLAALRKAFTGVAIVFEAAEPPRISDDGRPGRVQRVGALLGQVLEQRSAIVQLLAISALVQGLSAALPLLTGVLIDRVVPRRDYSLLALLASGYAGLQLFNALSGYVREYLSIHVRTRLEAAFTLRFLDHLIRLPYAFFQQRTSGDLMMRLGSNTAVRDILTSTLLSTVLDGMMASVYLVLLVVFSPALTLVVLALAAARWPCSRSCAGSSAAFSTRASRTRRDRRPPRSRCWAPWKH